MRKMRKPMLHGKKRFAKRRKQGDTMTRKPSPTEQTYYNVNALLLNTKYLTFSDTDEIYSYNGETGLYEEAETNLKKSIQYQWQDDCTVHIVNESIALAKRLSYVDRKETEKPNLLPLENGVFDLTKNELLPYSQDHFFTFKHPIHYNQQGEAPKFKQFLEEVTEKDAQKQETLLRIIGYCFYRAHPSQKAIMLIGTGANGKSVYLNIIRTILGQKTVTSMALQELIENRFAPGRLYGKNANIFADLESKALKSTGIFKSLTGGDYLTCDRKFKESFDFLSHAKLLFSCNQMPAKADESDAFYRRWVIIEFTRVFTPEEQNPTLICDLTAPEELSGIFNLAKDALIRTLKENRLDFATNEEIRERYAKNSDSAKAFCYDRLELSPEDYLGKPDLYATYIQYCKAEKIPVKSEKSFFRSIYLFFEGQVYEFRPSILDTEKRVRAMRGIRYKEIEKEESINKEPEKEEIVNEKAIKDGKSP